MTGASWSRVPKLDPTSNATFHWSTDKPNYNLPPDPNIIANWTTAKIIYLTYFLSVPIAAIIFLIWVHIRWPEKPVKTKTEVPSQTIEVDKGVEGAETSDGVASGEDVEKMDSACESSMDPIEQVMVGLPELVMEGSRERRTYEGP